MDTDETAQHATQEAAISAITAAALPDMPVALTAAALPPQPAAEDAAATANDPQLAAVADVAKDAADQTMQLTAGQ